MGDYLDLKEQFPIFYWIDTHKEQEMLAQEGELFKYCQSEIAKIRLHNNQYLKQLDEALDRMVEHKKEFGTWLLKVKE